MRRLGPLINRFLGGLPSWWLLWARPICEVVLLCFRCLLHRLLNRRQGWRRQLLWVRLLLLRERLRFLCLFQHAYFLLLSRDKCLCRRFVPCSPVLKLGGRLRRLPLLLL